MPFHQSKTGQTPCSLRRLICNHISRTHIAPGKIRAHTSIPQSCTSSQWFFSTIAAHQYQQRFKQQNVLETSFRTLAYRGQALANTVKQQGKVQAQFLDQKTWYHCQHMLQSCQVPLWSRSWMIFRRRREKHVIFSVVVNRHLSLGMLLMMRTISCMKQRPLFWNSPPARTAPLQIWFLLRHRTQSHFKEFRGILLLVLHELTKIPSRCNSISILLRWHKARHVTNLFSPNLRLRTIVHSSRSIHDKCFKAYQKCILSNKEASMSGFLQAFP